MADEIDGAATRRAEPAKTTEVRVRLTERDKAAFAAAAERDGLPISSWLRSVAKRWLREEQERRTR